MVEVVEVHLGHVHLAAGAAVGDEARQQVGRWQFDLGRLHEARVGWTRVDDEAVGRVALGHSVRTAHYARLRRELDHAARGEAPHQRRPLGAGRRSANTRRAHALVRREEEGRVGVRVARGDIGREEVEDVDGLASVWKGNAVGKDRDDRYVGTGDVRVERGKAHVSR